MWDKLRPIVGIVLAIGLAFWLVACGGKGSKSSRVNALSISEVSPPPEIQRLNRTLDRYMPQVTILRPSSDQVLTTTDVEVEVAVKDLPIFKSELGLGNHIDVILDERQTQQTYDPATPLLFNNVTPGTHTLRVFASKPWDESFKNVGAYAQTTFHVLTRTGEHVPRTDTPVLTYHSPIGTVGSDTVLLDFYLHNAPVPPSLLDSREPSPWQVRATVNGDSFPIEDWHSLYLKGLKPGQNWLKLEFLDAVGNPLANLTNSMAQIVTYDPSQVDPKSRLLKGEIIPQIDQIVDPNYRPAIVKPDTAPQEVAPPVVEETPVITPEKSATESDFGELGRAVPAKKPRFQLFKKVKLAPPDESLSPLGEKEQPPESLPVAPIEREEVEPIVMEEKEQPPESLPATPIESEEVKPIVMEEKEQPPESLPATPIEREEVKPIVKEENPTIEAEEQTKPIEEKAGRFQSLKARYQKIEQPAPSSIPERL